VTAPGRYERRGEDVQIAKLAALCAVAGELAVLAARLGFRRLEGRFGQPFRNALESNKAFAAQIFFNPLNHSFLPHP
jgi:hypothetical protein